MVHHQTVLSKAISFLLAMVIGASTVAPGLADTPPAPSQLPLPDDGAQRAYHDQTGKLRFLAAQPGQAIAVPGAQEATTVEDKAMVALSVYAQEFGLIDPVQELQVMEAPASTGGPAFVRYQQVFQGVPVLAGEMIVGADEAGNLLSMSGEVSPQPSLSITPGITTEQAHTTALEAVAKWYQLTPADLTATEPELWIYDERLLLPSTRPAELVWRMDVTATDLQPIDELVLVNAHTGGISLHFNQIDAAWGGEPPHAYNPFMQAGGTFYVATTGSDANLCTAPASPCATINGAIGKAANGDTIKVAVGTYTGTGTEVVLINKSVTLSGGWNAAFTAQSGMSTIDGEGVRRGVIVNSAVSATIERFAIQSGFVDSGYGGGIDSLGTLTLNNSIISNNTTSSFSAGAGISNGGTMTLNATTVVGNVSNWGGGGGILNGGNLVINNSSIHSNSTPLNNGAGGGGVANYSNGTIILNNSTISNNSATHGGGISTSGLSLTLNSSTVTSNTASTGGGIYAPGYTTDLQNSIIAGNTASSSPDCFGPIYGSLGYNLIGSTTGCSYTLGPSDITNVNVNLDVFTGSPGYHPLLPTNPAINAGNPTGCSGSTGLLTSDQRGVNRVGRCDIGAYEYNTPGVNAIKGTPQSTLPSSAFPLPLQVFVINSANNPVSNAVVTFSAPAGGPSGTFANTGTFTTTSTTDSNGVATASTFTANNLIGAYLVTASVTGFPIPANFQLNNLPPISTYTANNGTTLPGTLVCNQYQLDCTNGIDPHADAAHKYAVDTYSFYQNNHNRNSINNAGMTIVSTVHYCSKNSKGVVVCPFANAFWTGAPENQMVYGDAYGYPLADDVVAHELTHGVTQFESGLFYYYQSGAINESFSDVWGEFVDQTNGAGDDSAAVKWKIGEDISGLGAIRDMKNPPTFDDPDKMTSPLYYTGNSERFYGQYNGDNGGVHNNSGVNNKAAYLMTDGGTFNGKTVTGLGIPKVAAIYYEVQTNLLTSGADYADLYYALSQACANLVGGSQGITNENCQAVRDAADAVEMNKSPNASYNPEAPFCPTNMSLSNTLFSDDLEAGAGNWTFSNFTGTYLGWSRTTGYAAGGLYSLYANDSTGPKIDGFAAMNTSFPVTAGQATFLHFKHAFGFEQYPISPFYNFDGGWLEYSTDNGSNWFDAKPLFSAGRNYSGSITTAFGTPNGGHPAFTSGL